MRERRFSSASCYKTEGSVSEVVQYVHGHPSNSVSTRHQRGLAAAAEPGVLSDRGPGRAVSVPGVPPSTSGSHAMHGTGHRNRGKAPSSGRNFLSPTLQLKAAH